MKNKDIAKEPIKSKIENLPEFILGQILDYSDTNEIISTIQNICLKFHTLITENGNILSRIFLRDIKVPFYSVGNELAELPSSERMEIIERVIGSDAERISIFSYFTDGGVDKADPSFFIGNIFCDNPSKLYSSVKGENINVKAVCSETIGSHFKLENLSTYVVNSQSTNIAKKVGDETYRLPIEHLLSKHDPQNSKKIGILNYVDINRAKSGYTCFLQSFALFVSMNEIDSNSAIVELFSNTKTYEEFQKLGFSSNIIQEDALTKVVEFDLSNIKKVEGVLQKHKGPTEKLYGVYPLLWGELSKKTHNYLNISQKIGFRYLLLKLIDSNKTSGDANIDCYSIRPSGSYIKLKHSFEE